MESLKETVKSICSLLNQYEVDYIVIGGFAVIHHGYPRTTTDLDIWYSPSVENYLNIVRALEKYGLDVSELKQLTFDSRKTFLKIPTWGFRTEFLPQVQGIDSFREAKKKCENIVLDGVSIPVIGYADLIKTKLSTNRLKDQTDLEELKKRHKKGN